MKVGCGVGLAVQFVYSFVGCFAFSICCGATHLKEAASGAVTERRSVSKNRFGRYFWTQTNKPEEAFFGRTKKEHGICCHSGPSACGDRLIPFYGSLKAVSTNPAEPTRINKSANLQVGEHLIAFEQ